jgi:hypothetical protein
MRFFARELQGLHYRHAMRKESRQHIRLECRIGIYEENPVAFHACHGFIALVRYDRSDRMREFRVRMPLRQSG